jgi:hypothetical protein
MSEIRNASPKKRQILGELMSIVNVQGSPDPGSKLKRRRPIEILSPNKGVVKHVFERELSRNVEMISVMEKDGNGESLDLKRSSQIFGNKV